MKIKKYWTKPVAKHAAKMGAAIALTAGTAAPAYASSTAGSRGILDLIKDIGELGKAFGDSSLVIILALGLVVLAGGFMTIMLASKTQNQQATKSAGVWAVIIGFCLTGITGIIEMGNQTITQEKSEYSEFFDGAPTGGATGGATGKP